MPLETMGYKIPENSGAESRFSEKFPESFLQEYQWVKGGFWKIPEFRYP